MGAPLEIKGRIVEMEQLSMNDVCCHGNGRGEIKCIIVGYTWQISLPQSSAGYL